MYPVQMADVSAGKMAQADVDAILAGAPLKQGLNPLFKNCVRLDIWQASDEQLQAELLRLDEILHKQRSAKNKTETGYKNKRYHEDADYRQKELARNRDSKSYYPRDSSTVYYPQNS